MISWICGKTELYIYIYIYIYSTNMGGCNLLRVYFMLNVFSSAIPCSKLSNWKFYDRFSAYWEHDHPIFIVMRILHNTHKWCFYFTAQLTARNEIVCTRMYIFIFKEQGSFSISYMSFEYLKPLSGWEIAINFCSI